MRDCTGDELMSLENRGIQTLCSMKMCWAEEYYDDVADSDSLSPLKVSGCGWLNGSYSTEGQGSEKSSRKEGLKKQLGGKEEVKKQRKQWF